MENKKLKTFDEIQEIVENLRRENPDVRVVTTNGCFDLVHAGHALSFEKAKSYGDVLIVGLNSDASVRQYKSSNRPLIPQLYRAKMIASLGHIDYVVIFDDTDPRNLLRRIKPNYHVKSASGFKAEPGFKDCIERETVEEHNGEIITIEDVEGISTTQIITKIRSAEEGAE